MNRLRSTLAAIALLALAAPGALAQASHGDHALPGSAKPVDAATDPAAREYKLAMDKMHAAMAAVMPSGDADVDFARGMIPHHQAAIDMAKTVLAYGKDPEIRMLASDIVAAQQREIGQLEKWLAQHKRP